MFQGCPVTDAYNALTSLRAMLVSHREEFKEKLACGSSNVVDASKEQTVGQCKALKWTIDKINEQVRSINGGSDKSSE